MKILIYGGTGFIGNKLSDHFVSIGYEVANVSRKKHKNSKVLNFHFNDAIQNILEQFKADKIIYLSACFDNLDIKSMIDINIGKPLEILKILEIKNHIEFIYFGSYWQFGDESNPFIPIDIYSCSKKAMSSFFDYYNTYTVVSCKEIVLYGTYGRADSRGKILDYLIESTMNETPVEMSEGMQKLNLVNVASICSEIEKICKEKKGKKFLIKSSKNYSIIEIVNKINKIKTLKSNFGTIPYKNVEIMNPVFDNSYSIIEVEDELSKYLHEQLSHCEEK